MESATLEFPTIAAPAEPRTEVATAAATVVDLERIDLKKLALARFGDWRAALDATTENLNTLVLDLSTAAKCKEARGLRQRLIGDPLTGARKVAADTKSKMAATSKAVGAELDTIESEYEKADALILPKIVAREQELEAERQEKARIEADRVAKHRERIANVHLYLTACNRPGMTSERIALGIKQLSEHSFDKALCEEFDVETANAQCETLEAMRQLHAQVLGREQEAARQEAIRLENERQAEANRLERKRIDDEAAEIRRQSAELDALRAAAAAPAPAPAPTPVTAAGFASLGERFTDPDPDAATKLPTGEVVETMDPQEGVGLMEVAPAAPAAEQANISLTALKEWLQMPSGLTREFVEALGIKPTIEGRSILFTAGQKRALKAALLIHIAALPEGAE